MHKKKFIFAPLFMACGLLIGGVSAAANHEYIEANAAENLISTVVIKDYAAAQTPAWANGEKYPIVKDKNITYTAGKENGNAAKYYTNGQNWRFYSDAGDSTKNDSITISVDEGYELVSTTLTFTDAGTNGGALMHGSVEVLNNTKYALTGTSAKFVVTPDTVISGKLKNGQIKFTKLVTEYKVSAGATVTAVTIDTPDASMLYESEEITLSGSTSPADANQALVWSIDKQPGETGEATLNDNKLLLTKAGDLTIKATSVTNTAVSKTLKLTIKAAPWASLTYEGELAPQKIGNPFDATGLTFTGTRKNADGYSKAYVLEASQLVIPTTPLAGEPNVEQTVEVLIKGTTIKCPIKITPTLIKENTYTPIKTLADLATGDVVVIVGKLGELPVVATNSENDKYEALSGKKVRYSGENVVIDDLVTCVAHYKVEKGETNFSLLNIALNKYLTAADTGTDLSHVDSPKTLKLVDGVRIGGNTPLIQVDNGATATARALLFNTGNSTFKNYFPNNKGGTQASDYGEIKLYKLTGENKAVSLQDALTSWSNYHLHMNDYKFKGDGEGACYNLYGPCKNALNELNKVYPGAIEEFKTNESLSAARARYEAWARAKGDTTPYDGKTFIQNNAAIMEIDESNIILIVVITASIAITAIAVLAIYKRKKLVK